MRAAQAFAAGVGGGIVTLILEWFARTFMAMNVDIEMIWGTMFLPHSSNGWLFGMMIHLIVSGIIGLNVRWRYASPTPVVAGVTTTAGGIVFAADLNGNFMAFDSRNGAIRFRYNTGQPIGGGVVSYAVNGKQYVAVASGLNAPQTWQTKSSAAKVVVLTLP